MVTVFSITGLLLAGIVLLLKFKSLFISTIRSLDYIRKYFYVINDSKFIAAFSRLRRHILIIRNMKVAVAVSYFISLAGVFTLFFRHSALLQSTIALSFSLLAIEVILNYADQLLYRYLTTILDNIFSGQTSKYAPVL